MISPSYQAQFALLLRILPQVAKEECFALKGGTAINLFVRNLPRLSLDIDLSYLPLDDRQTALRNISVALGRIKAALGKSIQGIQVITVAQEDKQEAKLICRYRNAQVKIEVNTVLRGHIQPVRFLQVCSRVQEESELFAAMYVISQAELFGGKICAALDRQHPRDIFDVHLLFENEGLNDDIRLGAVASLVSHPRPIHEIINPNLSNQRSVFERQFTGMANIPFRYEEYEATRKHLIQEFFSRLTDYERNFLLSFKRGEPDWDLVPFENLRNMPAVTWKLSHIKELIIRNPEKNAKQLRDLEEILFA